MKKLLVFLVLMCFISCDEMIITESGEGFSNYVVTKIESYRAGANSYSKYFLRTDKNYFYYKNNIEFISYNGKFKVGDTIYVVFTTKPAKDSLELKKDTICTK